MGFLQETQSVKHCTAVYSRCMADMLLSIVIYAYQSARVQWGLGSIFTPLSQSRAFCQNCCRKDEETDVYTGLKIYTIYLLTQEKLCSYDKCYKYFISMIRDPGAQCNLTSGTRIMACVHCFGDTKVYT